MDNPLNDRSNEILSLLIGDYIATANAVGSRQLSKKIHKRLSPATIRNVMADLEDLGYLAQLHTSAGRVPTQKGLRYYVDTLIEKRDLNESEKNRIKDHYKDTDKDVLSVMKQTGKVLASISEYAGIVLTPKWDKTLFKHIEFLPLSHGRLLGIFVSQNGMVENKILEKTGDLNYKDLEKINNYCNACFVGLTLEEAREKIVSQLSQAQNEYDHLLSKALLLSQTMFDTIHEADVMVEGKAQLLKAPSTLLRVQKLVETLEEKQQLLALLDSCLNGEGMKIFIGSESRCEAVYDMSLITSTYSCDGKILGTLGVIGPQTMAYSEIIPVVDFTAKFVSDLLQEK